MTHPLFRAEPERVRWSGMTHPGRRRSNNEDSFLGVVFDGREIRRLGRFGDHPTKDADLLFAVSDGMGGASLGEFASRTAIDRVASMLTRHTRLSAQRISPGFQDFLTEIFQSVHDELVKLGRAYVECAGMGATLTLLWISSGNACFAHIGDSRLYFLPTDGPIQQLTQDHTVVGAMQRAGQISESEARRHPQRNILAKALGANQGAPHPQLGAVEVRRGDLFVLCSDGLVDGLSDSSIRDILRNPPPRLAEFPPAERLVREALDNSGRDNITALVASLE